MGSKFRKHKNIGVVIIGPKKRRAAIKTELLLAFAYYTISKSVNIAPWYSSGIVVLLPALGSR